MIQAKRESIDIMLSPSDDGAEHCYLQKLSPLHPTRNFCPD